MLVFFLLANAMKVAVIHLTFERYAGFESLLVHFIPTLFLFSAVFAFLLRSDRRLPFLAAYMIQSAYLAANFGFYLFFHDLLHLNCLYDLKGESFEVLASLAFTCPPRMLIILIDLPALAYLLWHFRQLSASLRPRPWFGRVPAGGALLFLISLSTLYATGPALPIASTSDNLPREMAIVNRFGFMAHHIYDLCSEPSSAVSSSRIAYGSKFKTTGGQPKLSNIVMIQFESLDANIVNCRHHGQYIAPFLHELAARNLYYPYTLCYRKAGGTSDCEVAVLNSIEPLAKQITMQLDLYTFPNALPKKLPHVYRTKAFHGNVGNCYLRDVAYPKMGFQEFNDIVKMGLPEEGWGASDGSLFKFVESQLAHEKSPFFYYVITMSSHEPFTNIRSYYQDRRFDDIDHTLTRNYFTSIAYSDAELEKFVTRVTRRFPDTYLFIYGDHTPYVINDAPYQRASVQIDQKELEFVPLIIVTPEHAQYTESRRVASYLDLAPTVLSASGAATSVMTQGVNLLNTPLLQTNVPHRGSNYSREQLYELASGSNAGNHLLP
jgi:phosphoglycerol transferase MdoB-like AlkP superfamily enzyme